MLFGVQRLPAGRRRDLLATATERSFAAFGDQVLAFDSAGGQHYATLVAARERAGASISSLDAQIAAICLSRGATLATRNVRHFDGLDLELVDPWAEP